MIPSDLALRHIAAVERYETHCTQEPRSDTPEHAEWVLRRIDLDDADERTGVAFRKAVRAQARASAQAEKHQAEARRSEPRRSER